MALHSRIVPWSGTAYRHLPQTVTKQIDVLNFSYAGRASDNRWNVKGQPTLYLAGDMGVALAEWSRHFVENTDPALATVPVKRTVWRLTLDIPRVLDMRDSAVWTDLSLTDAPHCFLDRNRSEGARRYAATGSGRISGGCWAWGRRDGGGAPVMRARQASVR